MQPVSYAETMIQSKKIFFNSSYKGTVGQSLARLIYYFAISGSNLRRQVCKEIVYKAPIVIYTRKNFYLLDEINEKIGLFQSAGLILFWHSQYVDLQFQLKETNPPKVLTVDHLIGCFYVLLVGCALSIICLILEILTFLYRQSF